MWRYTSTQISLGFHFPASDAYPLPGKPWVKSRADLIAHYTQGEDPALVCRYSEGPEEELIESLGEVFNRPGRPYPSPPAGAGEGGSGADLAMEW